MVSKTQGGLSAEYFAVPDFATALKALLFHWAFILPHKRSTLPTPVRRLYSSNHLFFYSPTLSPRRFSSAVLSNARQPPATTRRQLPVAPRLDRFTSCRPLHLPGLAGPVNGALWTHSGTDRQLKSTKFVAPCADRVCVRNIMRRRRDRRTAWFVLAI